MKKTILTKIFVSSAIIFCLGVSNASDRASCFPNACGGKGQYCQTPSLRIWDRFCESTGLTARPASGVYSGMCFHEADNRDPYYPHHGVVLIDKVNGKHHFGGEFSFFAKENPYKNLDVAAAKTKMPWFYGKDHEIKWNKDYARILLNSELKARDHVNYFVRTSIEDNKTLLLIGFWKGPAHRVFCRLKLNE
ncbi:MAG: hypothetical protein PVG96_01475 [Desulfobacterales bacterium]|jgi:hypothetical protein